MLKNEELLKIFTVDISSYLINLGLRGPSYMLPNMLLGVYTLCFFWLDLPFDFYT